mgnify:FL=1
MSGNIQLFTKCHGRVLRPFVHQYKRKRPSVIQAALELNANGPAFGGAFFCFSEGSRALGCAKLL